MRTKSNWLPLLPLIFVFVLAEVLVRNSWLPSYLVPAPSEILQSFVNESSELWSGFFQTFGAALLGFSISIVMGVGIGILLASSSFFYRAFYPYAIFFQTVPIIAIAPLLVIWFGFGMPTAVASACIVSIFPVIAGTLRGLTSTNQDLNDLFKLYRANYWAKLFKLQFPYGLPLILTGIQIGGGLAVIGAIVGEFIAGGGLGGVIDVARTRQRLDLVFAAVILAAFIGLVFLRALEWISRRVSDRRNA